MKYFFKRATSYLLDCLICYTLAMLIIQWALLSHLREGIGITDEWFEISWNMQAYVLLTISLPVWIYFTYFDSKYSGGTFGKRLMKLSITDTEQARIGLPKSLLRTILKLAPWEIAHIGVIFPTPLYFSQNADIRFLTVFGIALLGIYVLSVLLSAEKQSIYDRLLRTKVIVK